LKKVALVVVLAVLLVSLPFPLESLPFEARRVCRIYNPEHWVVRESENCPFGYQCRNGMWVPRMHTTLPMWVFGVSNVDQCDGILNFREIPLYPCTYHCIEPLSILYQADVIYLPVLSDEEYNIEDVPLTYIPEGDYIITSPSFTVSENMRIWYFPDDGRGPRHMHVDLKTNKSKYGGEEPFAILTLEITDEETGERIQVDSIEGCITLPDSTQKTLTTEDWSWNPGTQSYYYAWDFYNDDCHIADPKEGFYTAHVYVKKRFYEDVQASTGFGVCYHVMLTLEFDRDPPEYEEGEQVHLTVTAADENGDPVSAGVLSIIFLPDGTADTGLEWDESDPGVYSATYLIEQRGNHRITIEIVGETTCYLEEISGSFHVEECDKAFVTVEIGDTIQDEPAEFVLVIKDALGTSLSGAEIECEVCIPTKPPYTVLLPFTDNDDGTYTAEFTPRALGRYLMSGNVFVPGADMCFRGSFEVSFIVVKSHYPDLEIKDTDIKVSPAEPEPGDEVIISVTVRNVGEADAENFWVAVFIDGQEFDRRFVEVLRAHASITLEFRWKVLHSDTYFIVAVADVGKRVIQ
jgi:hypothetical protein